MRFLFSRTLLVIGILSSCQQDLAFTSDSKAVLAFSDDTVQFDTVFTTIGSTTKSFRFHNQNDNAVKTTISLSGGEQSNFRLNIDGVKTTSVIDYEIMGNDSIYVFVEVTVDPQNSNSPLVIEDSITFFTNGNKQNVKLVAYGQDVHLYNDSVIITQTWLNDKPYLIYNSVLIDSMEVLTIEAGAQLYFHHNSSMIVAGTLKSYGTIEDPIVFKGDRLEHLYDDETGQWGAFDDTTDYGGLLFLPGSTNNVIDHTLVKNSRLGLRFHYDEVNEIGVDLTLKNSELRNNSIGILSVSADIDISNSVISACNNQALICYGGTYSIYHSTFANYADPSTTRRTDPSVIFLNSVEYSEGVLIFPLSVKFGNCIVDGFLDNELYFGQYSGVSAAFNYEFDHCMLKLSVEYDISSDENYKSIVKIDNVNSVPRFVDNSNYNYRLDTLSAAKDVGKVEFATLFPYDADGISRLDDVAPDFGAFERVEGK